MESEKTISSIWGDSFISSSLRASASPWSALPHPPNPNPPPNPAPRPRRRNLKEYFRRTEANAVVALQKSRHGDKQSPPRGYTLLLPRGNGFRFSVSKTTCVHFHRKRIYTEPYLNDLEGQPIPVKGIQGNENVDKLAKAALNKASYSGKLICWSGLKPKVNAYIHTARQENWGTEGANNPHEVLPNLGEDLHKKDEEAGRKRETVMWRIRMGHKWSPRATF
ncbi:ribonuclease hi [Plakobranchus ocellatus]|uniref:Ribonuclease hi n=1 Tax=Plakobranchus ocellatus TaxID=259542 RepID=A0AAV3YN38_9GAST|nr:ribonuclease hi [Plakobranchus ocellatus]